MLVEMTGVHGIPTIQLRDRTEVDKPVHLDRFPIGTGSVGGNPAAYLGDLPQLGGTAGIFLGERHLVSQVRVSLGQQDCGVAGDRHGRQLLLLVRGLGVVHEIQGA